MEIGDVVMDAVKEVLRGRLGEKALRKIDSKPVRKRLSKRVFELVFFELLSTGVLKLPPGLGSFRTTGAKNKTVKVWDRKQKVMVERPARSRKILYRPGDTIREFL